jgi:alcohol dehydrogenase
MEECKMAAKRFYMPNVSIIGEGALKESGLDMKSLGFRKAIIVTDAFLMKSGLVNSLTKVLADNGIDFIIYDEVKANPTMKNVDDGLKLLKESDCDFVISFGGGSPHDCAKGIALLATNGGKINDYEGVHKSKKPCLPLVAINTTAGTASEMTIFCIITDEERHVKMAIVDKHVTAIFAVNDPTLMIAKPKALTAATGMDALTHAIEAYVSTAATPITDACAIKAMNLISQHLENAVNDGKNIEAREGMAYAQYLAGMAFNSASLGYVHAMAHQLGGLYDLPHGVCNAILLPHVQIYNKQVAPKRLGECGNALGINIESLTDEQAADKAIEKIVELSKAVGIPENLSKLNVKAEDFSILADNALKDACGFTNPKQATKEEIIAIFTAAL